MRRRTRRAILRTAAASVGATAVALALVTAASTVYTFGVASHRLPAGGWNTHRPGSGAWGASADRGRLYVTLDATAGGVPGPRRLHAGAEASPGVSLDLGLSDERVPVLAARLSITGDLDAAHSYEESRTVNDRLKEAVRRFQERHSLQPDGVAGPATLRELNVPVEQRIEQLRLTLERARWVLGGLGKDFVLVNIAAFRAYLIADRQVAWETRVVIGKAQQQTPVFRGELKYIVFNPTWTVPIVRRSR